MYLTTLKERKERGDLITIYKLMNNLEETDIKDIICIEKKRRGQKFEGTQKKIAKRNLLERYKKFQFSSKKYRYLEWTEGRGVNGKECTSTEGKTRQMEYE